MNPVMQHHLTNEIFNVTAILQQEYPAQYGLLGETPLFHFGAKGELSPMDFELYLESLISQLAAFGERPPVNNVSITQNCIISLS